MLETQAVSNVVELMEVAIRERSNAPESLTKVLIGEEAMANEILPRESAHEDLDYSSLSKNVEDSPVNQPERSSMLWWLGAMFECEGTFTLQYTETEEDGGLKSYIQSRLLFVNSDLKLVDRVERLVREIGYAHKPSRKDGIVCGIGRKKKSQLSYLGKKTLPLLKLLRPYIVGDKAECADCMIDFMDYRESLRAIKKTAQPYSEYEFALFRRIREINSGHWRRKPKFSDLSPETVRQRRLAAWKRADAKIQSGLHGDMQSAAEMTAPPSAQKLAHRRRQYPDYDGK